MVATVPGPRSGEAGSGNDDVRLPSFCSRNAQFRATGLVTERRPAPWMPPATAWISACWKCVCTCRASGDL